MVNVRRSIFLLFSFAVCLVLLSEKSKAQNCNGPNDSVCPKGLLFTDGVFFGYGTCCCKKTGPACAINFSLDLLLYTKEIKKLGCESPLVKPPCSCKTDETPVGSGGGGGPLEFDPANAKAIVAKIGSCDSYFVKVSKDGVDEYYRTYNASFNVGLGFVNNKFAIKSRSKPTNFDVQTYATSVSVSGSDAFLTVDVGNGSPATFKIFMK